MLCIPIMLLVKPLVLLNRHKKKQTYQSFRNPVSINDDQEATAVDQALANGNGKSQATIEFEETEKGHEEEEEEVKIFG